MELIVEKVVNMSVLLNFNIEMSSFSFWINVIYFIFSDIVKGETAKIYTIAQTFVFSIQTPHTQSGNPKKPNTPYT